VILTVLAALMRSQKHLTASLSSAGVGFKRVGLHYIAFSELTIAKTRLASLPTSKIAQFGSSATNFGQRSLWFRRFNQSSSQDESVHMS
jgi:hypothetical protein